MLGMQAEAPDPAAPMKGSRGGGHLVLQRGINEQRRGAGRGDLLSLYI